MTRGTARNLRQVTRRRQAMAFFLHRRLSSVFALVILSPLFLLLSSVTPCVGHSQVVLPRSLLQGPEATDQGEISALDMHELGLDDQPMSGSIGYEWKGGQRLESDEALSAAATTGSSSSSECELTYGVLPCSTTVVGNLFLLVVYGYLLLRAAQMLSDGSELLLTVMNPGVIGGLLLPVLGALPDSLLILVSGLGGTQAEAQDQVLVGIGLLAGSIVMLLTVLWGTCLVLGRCDLEAVDGRLSAVDKKLTKGWSLSGTGVENDNLTMVSSRIMIASILPFIVAQLPRIFGFSKSGNIAVLIACVLSLGGLLSYCLYQVFSPWIQERRKEIARKKLHKLLFLRKFAQFSDTLNIINESGELNRDLADKMFHAFDLDRDNHLSREELRYLVNVSALHAEGSKKSMEEDALEHIMSEFDVSQDSKISQDEFLGGMEKWVRSLGLKAGKKEHILAHADKVETQYHNEFAETEEDDDDEEKEEIPPTKSQIIRKAVLLLLGGTILAAVFADPLVDAVNDFSTATKIPSFFISFVLLPLASNSSEGVSSLLFSSRKRKKNMSLTYSQIYGGVTMNSTMGLGIFLAVVYGRQLVWDFSSEVLVIVLVVVVMGILTSTRKIFPLWMAGIAFLLYPVSLGLVAILDYVAGWE